MEKPIFDPNKKRRITRILENTGKSEMLNVSANPQNVVETIENLRREILLKYQTAKNAPKDAQGFLNNDAFADAKEIGLPNSDDQIQEGTTVTFDAEGRLMYQDLVIQKRSKDNPATHNREKLKKEKNEIDSKKYESKYTAGRYIIKTARTNDGDLERKAHAQEQPKSALMEELPSGKITFEADSVKGGTNTYLGNTELKRDVAFGEQISQQVDEYYQAKINKAFSEKDLQFVWKKIKTAPAEIFLEQKLESITQEFLPLAQFMHKLRNTIEEGEKEFESVDDYIKRALEFILKRDGTFNVLGSG